MRCPTERYDIRGDLRRITRISLRVTGKDEDKSRSILSSHPLTEDRLARMTREDRFLTGPPLLTDDEWASLKAICG
jgi:predicted Zn-dependent protease